MHAKNTKEVKHPAAGLIALGEIIFKKDGAIDKVSKSLSNPNRIEWVNVAQPTALDLNFEKFTQMGETYKEAVFTVK